MRFRRHLGILILMCSLMEICCANCLAFMDRYLPLSNAETRKSFPLRYCGELGPERLIKSLPAGPSGLSVTTNQDCDLVLAGKDRFQKPWMITIYGGGAGLPYDAFTGDLDHDGTPDLILICGTGGCGLAPSSHLLCFLFDERGRPVPFAADGYFDYDKNGIRDLLGMDEDGKAKLVYMNYDDGYWITSLYQASSGRWQKVEGGSGERTFPIYTRFTNRDNHTPVKPKPGRHPFAPDLSNTSPNILGSLQSYRWADVEQSEDIQLNVMARGGKRLTLEPVSWYSTFSVVLDEPGGRQIVSLDANQKSVKTLLNKIVTDGCRVTAFGGRRQNKPSPELLWATPAFKSSKE